MKFNFELLKRTLGVGLIGLLFMGSFTPITSLAHEHVDSNLPTDVKPWDEGTWKQMRLNGPRPAAYLFTTSYCSTCVEAFETIRSHVLKIYSSKEAAPSLTVVMMDVSGLKAQRHAAHFQGLNALYSFEGYEPAVRASVDPNWPEVTPYIVLVDAKGKLQNILGQPSQRNLIKWIP